jgi:hypothetical protein
VEPLQEPEELDAERRQPHAVGHARRVGVELRQRPPAVRDQVLQVLLLHVEARVPPLVGR